MLATLIGLLGQSRGCEGTNRKLKLVHRLGLGASIPKEGEIKRQKEKTDDILKRQLLGRDYKKIQANRSTDGTKSGCGVGQGGIKSLPTPMKRPVDVSDDEGGRSSLGRPKRSKLDQELQNGEFEATGAKGAAVHPNTTTALTASQVRKKPVKYLDEVLANKSQKRSKKKNRKTRHGVVPIAAE